MTRTLLLLAVITFPASSFAQAITWSGPQWPLATCPYSGQEIRVHIDNESVSVTGRWYDKPGNIRHVGEDTDNVYFQWWPNTAVVELLCGERFIVLQAATKISVQALIPELKK